MSFKKKIQLSEMNKGKRSSNLMYGDFSSHRCQNAEYTMRLEFLNIMRTRYIPNP